MEDSNKYPFTYQDLITLISQYKLNFYFSIVAMGQLFEFLNNNQKPISNPKYFRLIEQNNSTGIKDIEVYSENDLIEAINLFSNHHGYSFKRYCYELLKAQKQSYRDRFITSTFETIKNYSGRHGYKLITHLQSIDWFQILHMLRRNASHFHNYGKNLGGWPSNFPDILNWNGLTILKNDIGHEIYYTDKYVKNLIETCHQYLIDNEATLS